MKKKSKHKKNLCTVSVYLDTSVVHSYEVSSPAKGREHASQIIKTGYRHTEEGSSDLEWFPPHKIDKVKVSNANNSNYQAVTRAT